MFRRKPDPPDPIQPIIRSATRLDLEPGDVIVLETDFKLGQERVTRLAEKWGAFFPGEPLPIVLDRGLRIAAVLSSARARSVAVEVAAIEKLRASA